MRPVTRSAPIKAEWRRGYSAGRRGMQAEENPRLQDDVKSIEDLRGWPRLYAKTWEEGRVDGAAEIGEGHVPPLP